MSLRLFLYEPSKDNAYLSGLGYWWELLEMLPEATLVRDVCDVGDSGVFVSFSPIRSERDVYPELYGSVERWLYVDYGEGFSRTCLLARDAGVERVFHKRLVDEIGAHVPPAVIGYLRERGTWLPALDTLRSNFAKMDQCSDGRKPVKQGGCLRIVGGAGAADTAGLSNGGFGDGLIWDLLRGALLDNGLAVDEATASEVFSKGMLGYYQLYIVRDCDFEFVLSLVEFARVREANVLFERGCPVSPLSLRFLGVDAPVFFPPDSSSLKQVGRELAVLLRSPEADCRERSEGGEWLCSLSDSALTQRLIEGRVEGAVRLPEYLLSDEGAGYIKWLHRRMLSSPEDVNLALFLASELFRHESRFELLNEGVRSVSACFDSVEKFLVAARQLADGRGAYYSWYLGWIALLRGDFERVVSYFEGSRLSGRQGVLLICQFGVELFFALLYCGQESVAGSLLKVLVDYVGEDSSKSEGFVGVVLALSENVEYKKGFEDASKCQGSWLFSFSLGYLYSKSGHEELSVEHMRFASMKDPARTSLFCKTLGL